MERLMLGSRGWPAGALGSGELGCWAVGVSSSVAFGP